MPVERSLPDALPLQRAADRQGSLPTSDEQRSIGACGPAFFARLPVHEVLVEEPNAVRVWSRVTPGDHVLAVELPDGSSMCATSSDGVAAVTTPGASGVHRIWIGTLAPTASEAYSLRTFVPACGRPAGPPTEEQLREDRDEERTRTRGSRRRPERIEGMFEDLGAGISGHPTHPVQVELPRGCYLAFLTPGADAVVAERWRLLIQAGDGSPEQIPDGYRNRRWEASHGSGRRVLADFCISDTQTMTFSSHDDGESFGQCSGNTGSYTLELWQRRWEPNGMIRVQQDERCLRCRRTVPCRGSMRNLDACLDRFRACYEGLGARTCDPW